MSLFSVLQVCLQFLGLYTLLANQTFIPKEYSVQPIDNALQQVNEVYQAHLSKPINKLHENFQFVREKVMDEFHEMVDVERIRTRMMTHLTEGYEALKYAQKTSTEYTKKGQYIHMCMYIIDFMSFI